MRSNKGSFATFGFSSAAPPFPSGEAWCFATILRERGIDPAFPMQAIGIPETSRLDSACYLTLDQVISMHRLARRYIGCAELELAVAERQHINAYGNAGLAVMSSATLRVVFDIWREYRSLFGFKTELEIRRKSLPSVEIHVNDMFELPPDVRVAARLLDVAKILVMLRDILGRGFAVEHISLHGATHDDLQRLSQFANCPVTEGRATSITIPASICDRTLLHAHEVTFLRSVQQCQLEIELFRRHPALVTEIRNRLDNLTDGVPSFSALARDIGMSERTLRRRLLDLGTSYTAILDEVRFEKARLLLLQSGVTTDMIARKLGYTETSNFRHAFRRWAGHSPQSFREGQRNMLCFQESQRTSFSQHGSLSFRSHAEASHAPMFVAG
ncbi:AraC family transcriptional regulator ligand-binding domain-containing protein [Nguyenibacter sp. L1]|uniref:AraC family transcriptional regulator n=1 Tax=Nguyenibacter sp. L1 TaxID=3049350 RepID=UPI002B47BF94|nr:AraC family transcriptional regulator ligand-binding domain-containing protein [Nguyenibacter sp. L1]WRH89794.1 AraC family transcriptional regulator ligand-binding domain-containing protein [Nguyenibacter sp. L1]